MNVPKIQETADQKPVASVAAELRSPQIIVNNGMASVHLSLAVCDYDHVRDLANGQVRVDGIVLNPYGIEESRPTLEAFCRYAHDQGVTGRRMTTDDLFPREVRASAKV